MIESTQVLHQLKVATNYSKLAMHKCGPRSFKSGQGAMCKVCLLYTSTEDGALRERLLHANAE